MEQENKIIEVCFDDRYEKTVHGITQWDKGTKLVISGLALKEDTQVHFCLEENEGDASRMMGMWDGKKLTVDVPAFILEGEETCCYPYEGSYHAFAWVYVTGENYAESVRKINMHIRKRPKPEDYVYTPKELKTWEDHEKRIEYLEQNGTGGGSTSGSDEIFEVVVTKNGDEYVADKTNSEIYEAYTSGKLCMLKYSISHYFLRGIGKNTATFVSQPTVYETMAMQQEFKITSSGITNEYRVLKVSGSGATTEQIEQIEKNKTDIGKLSDTVNNKADKQYVVSVFEELKRLLQNGETDSAIAVLDKAILDLSTLA